MMVMTCPISAARGERSFSKLKFIKTFYWSTIMDDRLTSLALILKVLAFAVWTTTTSLMFLPPKRHQILSKCSTCAYLFA